MEIGIKDETRNASAPGAHADEWNSSPNGSGISVSSVADSPRRSDVIKCTTNTTAKPTFRTGEKDGNSDNPGDSPWNSTKRKMSFWMKGGAGSMNVQVSAGTGAKRIQYLFDTGTNGALSGGNAMVYLGAPTSADWMRFERNIEAEYEAHSGGASG